MGCKENAKGCNGQEYTTYTEEGEQIKDPTETKEHIANYFEDLYQAREGKVEYQMWTEKITKHVKTALNEPPSTNSSTENKISDKEMDRIIKRLKRNKSWVLIKFQTKSSSKQTGRRNNS